jgi:hypothetical protein
VLSNFNCARWGGGEVGRCAGKFVQFGAVADAEIHILPPEEE